MKNLLGESPLIAASDRGHAGVVNTLLAHGANPNSADSKGAAALMEAVMRDHETIIEKLIECGAEKMEPTDAQSASPAALPA